MINGSRFPHSLLVRNLFHVWEDSFVTSDKLTRVLRTHFLVKIKSCGIREMKGIALFRLPPCSYADVEGSEFF